MPDTQGRIPLATKTRADLLKRLDSYWKMEAANVLFVPLFLFWLSGWRSSWITLLPMAATMLLLIIGALYWRGKVQQLSGKCGEQTTLKDSKPTGRNVALRIGNDCTHRYSGTDLCRGLSRSHQSRAD